MLFQRVNEREPIKETKGQTPTELSLSCVLTGVWGGEVEVGAWMVGGGAEITAGGPT